MKTLKIIGIAIAFILVGCTDDTIDAYHYDFYSIFKDKYYWLESSFISGDTVAFRLDSYKQLKCYNEYEQVVDNSISLICDKDILIGNDTILKNENLFKEIPLIDKEMVSFERQIYLNNQPDNFYHLIIHSTKSNKLILDDGYYKFKISAKTVNGYNINDSVLIKYYNR